LFSYHARLDAFLGEQPACAGVRVRQRQPALMFGCPGHCVPVPRQ